MDEIVINVVEENDLVTVQVTEMEENVTVIISEGFVGDLVYGEVLSGTVNGSNASFSTQHQFSPETVEVFINGLKAKKLVDYTTQGASIINFITSPEVGDELTINYLKLQ